MWISMSHCTVQTGAFDLWLWNLNQPLLDWSKLPGMGSLEVAGFDELIQLLKPLRDAWEQMPEAAKQEGIQKLNEKNASQAIGA